MEVINTELIAFGVGVTTFLAAWIVAPLVKNSSRMKTLETRQANNIELVATCSKEIAEMKTFHSREIAALKEAWNKECSEIKAKQSWQETAEYIMGSLTKAVEGLQATVMAWDGKLTGILIQITQVMGDVKVAKEAADRANERLDNIEGSTRAKNVISSSGR
jgi:outer membrane murein-binding lipoprotein Lpp